jgi:hypothetical protein
MISAVSLLGTVSVARADEHWDREHGYREHEFREHEFHQREYLDSRYHHDHYYPPVGFAFGVLPAGHVVVRQGGVSFYFAGGVWYSAAGPARFVVVAPPLGVVVPVLPPFYATVWVGSVPYYYANNVYYVQSPQGYVVVNAPPPTTVVEQPPSVPPVQPPSNSTVAQIPFAQLSTYPNHGQSEQQQATDRYECHRYAVGQSGFDPSVSNGPGATEQQVNGYRRAMTACLDARGYTVW